MMKTVIITDDDGERKIKTRKNILTFNILPFTHIYIFFSKSLHQQEHSNSKQKQPLKHLK